MPQAASAPPVVIIIAAAWAVASGAQAAQLHALLEAEGWQVTAGGATRRLDTTTLDTKLDADDGRHLERQGGARRSLAQTLSARRRILVEASYANWVALLSTDCSAAAASLADVASLTPAMDAPSVTIEAMGKVVRACMHAISSVSRLACMQFPARCMQARMLSLVADPLR